MESFFSHTCVNYSKALASLFVAQSTLPVQRSILCIVLFGFISSLLRFKKNEEASNEERASNYFQSKLRKKRKP